MRGRRRQSSFDDADVERQTCAELSGEARTPIGAIVGEYDNANQRRRNRLPQPVALLSKSAQAGRQALFFIPDGYGDNKTWSDGRGRALKGGAENRAAPAPDGSSNIKIPELAEMW